MKTISDHILDIIQNSIRAKATLIEIIVDENRINDICILEIKDNGLGMDEQTLKSATNPFFTSRNTRKVGLGLSLLKQNAEQANGTFFITSEVNKGTEVKAVFQLSNVDKPPMGDIWETLYFTMLSNKTLELIYSHVTENGVFTINSTEIKNLLAGVSFKQKEIKDAVIDLIRNNLKDIKATY